MTGADNGTPAGPDVMGILVEIVSGICGLDESQLTADRRVRDLGIDSLMAGEILAHAETALQTDIDFQRLPDDWSELTLGTLAAQLTAAIEVRP